MTDSRVFLSKREKDILKGIASGLEATEVAHSLNISKHTVHYHLKNVNIKLSAKNRTHAVCTAIILGLIEMSDSEITGDNTKLSVQTVFGVSA